MGLGLFLTACNPMDDIYNELDAQETLDPRSVVGDDAYTLTDDDYAALGLTYGSFNSEEEAKAMLPDFLSGISAYDYWLKNSSVLVGYQLYVGSAEGVSDYTGAAIYTLTEADYATSGSDVLGFYPDLNPASYLDDILAANISAPEDGQIELAKYIQYTEVPVVTTTTNFSLADDFDYGSTAGDLTALSDWKNHSGGSPFVEYATTSLSMSNYPSSNVGGSALIDGYGSEDVSRSFTPLTSGTVYLSALVNLSAVGADSGTYFFHVMDDGTNFRGRVGVKSDGNGKMLFGIGASSSTLTFGATSFDFGTTYLVVASYNIDNGTSNLYVLTTAPATEPGTPEATNTGSSGTTIERVAIRQGFNGPTGSIDGVRVTTTWNDIMVNDIVRDVVGDKVYSEVYYTFSGSYWNPSTGAYPLSSDDYDSMGTASGQPGKYNNFDSSMDIDKYISTFLAIKYPYANDKDNLIIIYKYYSSSAGATQTRGNSFTVVDGVWTSYQSTISTTLQFGYDGKTWVPDNTIKYKLVNPDYEYISAELSTDPEYADLYVNLAKYHDYDYNWTQAQIAHSLGILADHLNPTAEEGQKYIFNYLLYDNGLNNIDMNLILTNGVWVINN